jgi:predicted transcriptional regulator of viral defense system
MKQEREFQLYRIAEDQAGYFSLAQAREIGLRRNQIYRGLKRGKFAQAGWGVYRFVEFPASRFEEIHIAVLSAGQHAVVGFQTALYVYDLSDIIPDEIHLILPPTSSRRRTGIRVHTNRFNPKDITYFEGLLITAVAKTIVDCAFAHVDDEQIRIAVFQSLRRGMTTKQKLVNQAKNRSARVQELISRIVKEVEL